MAYLEINNVCKGFGSGTARFEVLKNINLHVKEGEFVAILGYSGVGKSTLMNLIAGLEEPDSGEIIVNGKKIDGPHPDRGLVFQNYSLLPFIMATSYAKHWLLSCTVLSLAIACSQLIFIGFN